ncbi:MAG: cytochrome P450 [Actinomycetota bacterium]
MATTAGLTLDGIDLSDPELYATGDPHAVWTYLRANAPVFFQKHRYGPGFWAITRYEDVLKLSTDRRLSSAGGRSTLGTPAQPDAVVADVLVVTDPPKHTQLRTIVNKAFTPRIVASLETYVQSVVDRIVDGLVQKKNCDFATEVAAQIPFNVICELLGAAEEDRGSLAHAVGHFMESNTHIEAPARNDFELGRYFLDLAEQRRHQPGEDLVSRLVEAEVEGESLSNADILALCSLLFIAGSETTMNGISGGLLAFMENPAQRDRIEEDPSLWPKAVEEILRWVSPVLNGMVRTATEDIEVREVAIKAGDKVTLWYPSANRDEDVFNNPFAFDVGRDPNPHITFGAGPHFCLGASLARLEIRVTLDTVFRRLKKLEPAGDVTRLRSNVSSAIEHLPIRFRGSLGA